MSIIGDIRDATLNMERKTLSQLALKTAEEVGELARVVLIHDKAPGTKYRNMEQQKAKEEILEEAVDVVQCALATLYRAVPDLTDEELAVVFAKKLAKWRDVLSRDS